MSLSFLEESAIPNDLLQVFRNKAWDALSKIGLPNRKFETYQHVPLIKLYAHDFFLSEKLDQTREDFSEYLSEDFNDLILVNGFYRPDLSSLPKGVEIHPLRDAMDIFAMFLQNKFHRSMKQEKDPFALMNLALHKDGLFIYLPDEMRLSKPLRILNFISSIESSPCVCFSNLQIFMGKNSSMDLMIASHHLSGVASDLMNASFDIHQEENAKLNCYEVIDCAENNWYFGSYRHHLKKYAELRTVGITSGAKTVRRDIQISLLESDASAYTAGLCFLKGEKQAHTNVLINHEAPLCVSSQLFKTVLKDQARSSFEGKIFVKKQAQETKAYQLNKNLLLSDEAKCHCKPNLEIFADDVKASHGATVGQLSKEDLFYMQSRGISQENAKKILVRGFCKEILEHFPFPSYIQKLVDETS